MKRKLSIIISLILVAVVGNQAEAQSLMQTAKKAEQRAKELKQQETARYNAIVESKDLAKYNQYITDYPRGSKTPEIKKRAEEVKLWNNARSANSILSYQNYLNSTQYHWYDVEANNAIKSLKQSIEKTAWEKVKQTNTLQCYQEYLRDNPTSGYKTEVEQAINRLQGASAWNKIKRSDKIEEIQFFVDNYPCADAAAIAIIRLHELKGCKYYQNGDMKSAYLEFAQIAKEKVSYSNMSVYEDVMEYHEFSKLSTNSSQIELNNYLSKFPNGKYSNQVSNFLAISKAKDFGDNASIYDYNAAVNYATDEHTRNVVMSYISINKKKQKELEKAEKYRERAENGGILSIGVDFMDWGFNCEFASKSIMYYNAGLLFRIGNYKDRLQFAFGVKPGVIVYDKTSHDIVYVYDYSYESKSTRSVTDFHMPIVGQLKLNLINLFDWCRFYMYGQYQYNVFRAKEVEHDMSWGVGMGIAWKHIDWSFYYRRDIGRPVSSFYKKQDYLAMSFIFYWQLK